MAKERVTKSKKAGLVSGDSYVLPTWVHEDLAKVAKTARVPAKQLRAAVDDAVAEALSAELEEIREDASPVAVAKKIRAAQDAALEDL